jgi:hypothetical protein
MTKYFTFDLLRKINRKSIRANLNRTLTLKFLSTLETEKLYPIVFSMPHNDDHMRVRFVHNDNGNDHSSSWIDLSFKDYDSLPEVAV